MEVTTLISLKLLGMVLFKNNNAYKGKVMGSVCSTRNKQ